MYVAVDGVFGGYLVIADEVKPDAADMVKNLRKLGVKNIVMLTGDNPGTAQQVAEPRVAELRAVLLHLYRLRCLLPQVSLR